VSTAVQTHVPGSAAPARNASRKTAAHTPGQNALVGVLGILAFVWVIPLAFILFIAVIASFVQLVEMVVEKYAPALYSSLGIFLPLIAVNCAIMGGSLFMQQKAFVNVGTATIYGLGSGIGWMLAIVGMAAIREKLAYSDVPKPLRGLGIAFILTGLMGMAFMCFSGFKI